MEATSGREHRIAAYDRSRTEMYRRELGDRAALFYRLGYPIEHAIARLQANAEWDFEIGAARPGALDADAVAEIARAIYARRPGS